MIICYHATMIDGISYGEFAWQRGQQIREKAIASFLSLIERRVGIIAMVPMQKIPKGQPDLVEPFLIGEKLLHNKIVKSFSAIHTLPDEPPYKLWKSVCGNSQKSVTNGIATESDRDALYGALAEGLERYLWYTQWDYFKSPSRMDADQIRSRTRHIAVERFNGFLKPQSTEKNSYTWIRSTSLIDGAEMYIPAQTVSGAIFPGFSQESLIRERTTCGLATWPDQAIARLSGALEVIEHDAFAILWFNQLTMPRIQLTTLIAQNQSLSMLLARCARYNLIVHAMRMPTDAPTHAVCVVLEDASEKAPRFTFGLKAHWSLAHAVEKAALEALRARQVYRSSKQPEDSTISKDRLNSIGRLFYWGKNENAQRLEFLIRGPLEDTSKQAWENDSPSQHLIRIISWCKERSYECVAVSLGTSRINPVPWHVEMVVMPDLQPLHMNEHLRSITSPRITEVPRILGLSPRATAFIDEPHPFF